ncbi:MAG: vWA domain-containing protein [Spirochaetota bacterium]
MVFKNPHILWSLVVLPLVYYFIHKRSQTSALGTSFLIFFPTRKTFRTRLVSISRGFLVACLGLLLVALARPQKGYIEEKLITRGIDIVLALDISSSMKAEDFKPNRLGAAKKVAKEFIAGRNTDRIGLVAFSRKAVTQSPLTVDYSLLYQLVDNIEIGMIPDGTAIGNAIAEASRRLQSEGQKSRVLILLTDGINNAGEIDPLTAARAAQALDIKIYTIGVGSKGKAPYPVYDQVFGKRYVSIPVQIDEKVLREIARITGGGYFRATDTTKLEEIYTEINNLEKSKIEINQYRRTREWFAFPLLAAMVLFTVHVFITRIYLQLTP